MADPQENNDQKAIQDDAGPDSRPSTEYRPDTGKPTRKSTEHGGPKGLEPTRYGDWERNGRCTDF